MQISTNTSILTKRMSEHDAIKLLSDCGFSSLDLTMDDMWKSDSPKNNNYKTYAKELLALSDGLGVSFNQAHAPFHSSFSDAARTKKAYEIISRSLEFAALMGIPNIVVHPMQHLSYPQNAQRLKEMNLEFYNSLIPLCKAYNITILIENMWQRADSHITHSVCASAQELCSYVDMLNSDYIAACLDVGHAFLVKEDIPNMIKALNHRIKGLHIHDVSVDNDLHTIPFFASVNNWVEIMKALAETHYNGDLTFEIKNTDTLPFEFLPQYLTVLHSVGKELRQKFLTFCQEVE